MGNQNLLMLITIASRSKDWQQTLHRRLRDGNPSSIYQDIYQDIADQTKPSLEQLI